MDTELLRGKIVGAGTTQEAVARAAGLCRSTFHRKMKADGFTVAQARRVAAALGLSGAEILRIFFGDGVA